MSNASHAGAGEHGVDALEDLARRHPALVVLARAGWLAKGLVYAVAGALAFSIATQESNGDAGSTGGSTGGGGEEASQSGAIARIAESSAGTTALWVLAVGLLLYVLWRIVSILLPAENTPKVWAKRFGYLVSAVAYSGLAWSAISYARTQGGGGQESEDARVERFTADVLARTGGRLAVGLVGVVVVAVGCYFGYRAVTAKFRDELEPGRVGPISHDAIVRLGQVGWAGRAVMTALIGFFLARAALNADPDEAEGLDGALHRLVDTSWGPFVVAFVGIGLVLYGLYCVVSTPIRRLQGAD